jgi:hypothetical protein
VDAQIVAQRTVKTAVGVVEAVFHPKWQDVAAQFILEIEWIERWMGQSTSLKAGFL